MLGQITSLLRTQLAVEGLWLYLVILVPTLGFKVHYLNTMVVGGIDTMAGELLSDSTWWAFLGSDVLEVALLAALIVLPLTLMSAAKRPMVAIPLIVTLYLWMISNWISVKELSMLMTPNSMLISLSWVVDNPEHIKTYFHGRRELLLMLMKAVAFLGMAALPFVIARHRWTTDTLNRANPVIAILVAIPLLAVVAEAGAVRTGIDGPAPEPLRGYWSTSIRSVFLSSTPNLLELEVPPRGQLLADYAALTQRSTNENEEHTPILDLPGAGKRPRHIVIISLETAPKKYYQIENNPALPNLYRMSQQAISSDRHFANSPFTTWAIFSMLTGIYPNPGGRLERYGPFDTDSLAAVLKREGYQTTFIDSYKIDWLIGMSAHAVMWQRIGFDQLLDNTDQEGQRNRYEGKVLSETISFRRAIDAIVTAEAADTRSLTFVATQLGHYRWPVPMGMEDMANPDKLLNIAGEFDKLMGELLNELESRSILDDTIILVTGDHGLRYQNEFGSLDEIMGEVEASFNVPFMLYAPSLIDAPVTLDYVTSHVDITPTLLNLVGVDTRNMLHHGRNIFEPAIRDRITFLMNTRLTSTDWLHWQGRFCSYNWLTGKTGGPHCDLPDESPPSIFESANQLFTVSAAYALRRARDSAHTEPLLINTENQ